MRRTALAKYKSLNYVSYAYSSTRVYLFSNIWLYGTLVLGCMILHISFFSNRLNRAVDDVPRN